MGHCMRIAVVRMLEGGPACCSAVPAYASPKDGPTLVVLTSPVRLTAACRLYWRMLSATHRSLHACRPNPTQQVVSSPEILQFIG